MNLVKSTLTLQFDTATHPWFELRELMRTAASDPKIEMQAAPLVLERKDDKTRIVLNVRGVTVELEKTGPVAQSANEAQAMVSRLNDVSAFPDVRNMRFEAMFIEPFGVPFHELVNYMKDRFLKPTRIADASSDIALVFDEREDDVLKHIQVGPMDRAQLVAEFLKWANADDLPDTFLFLLLAYDVTRQEAFSPDVLESFLKVAIQWQESEAHSLVRELKEGGK